MMQSYRPRLLMAAGALVATLAVSSMCPRKGAVPTVGDQAGSPGEARPISSARSSWLASRSQRIGLPGVDLETRLKEALGQTGFEERRAAIERLGHDFAHIDPKRAGEIVAEWMRRDGGAAGVDAYAFVNGFVAEYGRIDPRTAFEWSLRLPPRIQPVAFNLLAAEWARQDMAQALAWSHQVDDPTARTTIIRALSQQVDLADASHLGGAWAHQLSREKDADLLSDVIAKHWALADPKAALEWAAGLQNEFARGRALTALTGVLEGMDPARIVQWVTALPPGSIRDQAIATAAQRWAEKDPSAAAQWALGLGEDARAALEVVTSQWLMRDPETARGWLRAASLPEETRRHLIATGKL